MKKIIILPAMFLFFVLMISLASSVEIYVKPKTAQGQLIPNTIFSYEFNFSTNSDCSGVVLSYSAPSVKTGVDGVAYVGAVNLDGISDVPLYVCEYKNDIFRKTHTLSDLVVRDIYARNITFSGSIFGDGSSLTGISAGYYPSDINLTSGTYNGSLAYSGSTGYAAGNAICAAEFTGSHMCNEFEIMNWFAEASSPSVTGDAWCSAGSPKYIPASVPVNDCNGWRYDGTATYLGNYWHFDINTGGDGRCINCQTELKLACCSY